MIVSRWSWGLRSVTLPRPAGIPIAPSGKTGHPIGDTAVRRSSPAMKDFEPSTLWPSGAFEQARQSLGAGRDDRATLLPTTLMADLRQLHRDPANDDVLEVIAACVRNHEAALLYLEHSRHVWPVTIFPREEIYHSPREVSQMAGAGMSTLRVIS